MRMKRSRVRTFFLRRRTVEKDSEGGTYPVWGSAVPVYGEIWPASSELQVETYGDRVNAIENVRLRGKYEIIRVEGHEVYAYDAYTIAEGDGLCVNVGQDEAPDYQIISIKPYRPIKMEIERL